MNLLARYACLAVVLYAVAWGLASARSVTTGEPIEFKVADAWGYYAYLPSFVIDGNLDFARQPIQGRPDAQGRPKQNRWPVGLALTIAPSFLLAHAIALPVHAVTGWAWFEPDGYSPVYAVLTLAQLLGFAALAFALGERLLRERFGVRPSAAFAAVLVFAFGTHYLWYAVREPYLSHVADAAWVLVAAWAFHRSDVASRGRAGLTWPWLGVFGFALAMGVACRMTGAVVLLPLLLVMAALLARRRRWRDLAVGLALVPLAGLPLAAQAAVLNEVAPFPPESGVHDTESAESAELPVSPADVGYERREVFLWTRPALVRTLLSSRSGLLFFAPVLIVAFVGVGRELWGGGWRDPLLAGLVASWLALWYLNSAWYAWWFGSSFGQRAMLGLSALGVIGLGLGLETVAAAEPARRRRLLRLIAVSVLWCWLLFGLRLLKVIPHNRFVVPLEKQTNVGFWTRF